MADPDDPRLRMRPLVGLAILVVPIVGVVATFVAYAVLVSAGLTGRQARGEEIEIRFLACEEAIAPIVGRLADMGLDAKTRPVPGGFVLKVAPPEDAEVARSIPATLVRPGKMEVWSATEPLATNADVVAAEPRLDLRMASYVVVRLDADAAERVKNAVRADPRGFLTLRLDDVEVARQPNATPIAQGEVEFAPPTDDDEERMHTIAEWGVILDHGPLPCPAEIVEKEGREPSG
jgi:hypothetical protein